MQDGADTTQKTRRKNTKGKWLLISILLIVVVVVLFVGGSLLGYLSLTVKTPEQRIVVVNQACDASVVEKYNRVILPIQDDDGEWRSDATLMAELKQTIDSKKNWQQDSTCQVMKFWIANYEQDKVAAQSSYEALVNLESKGANPSGTLDNLTSLSSYAKMLERLNEPSENSLDEDTSAN